MTNASQIDVKWNLELEWNCISILYTVIPRMTKYLTL
jgi:hypothetical protein